MIRELTYVQTIHAQGMVNVKMLQDNVDVIKDGKEKLVKKLNVEKIQEKLMELVNVKKDGPLKIKKEI